AAAALIVWVLASGTHARGLPDLSWVAIALSAIVSSVIGHTLLNRAVRTTPTHLVALAILGEPVGASLLVWVFFAERPPAHAAHACCYSLALAFKLTNNGTPPTELHTEAKVELVKKEAGWTIPSIHLECTATVPGVDAAKFAELAEDAKKNCPVSRALAGAEI